MRISRNIREENNAKGQTCYVVSIKAGKHLCSLIMGKPTLVSLHQINEHQFHAARRLYELRKHGDLESVDCQGHRTVEASFKDRKTARTFIEKFGLGPETEWSFVRQVEYTQAEAVEEIARIERMVADAGIPLSAVGWQIGWVKRRTLTEALV